MTRALVLSGGGSKGAFQVGVLNHLIEDVGLEYDIVTGVSVGALNAAIMSQFDVGRSREALECLESIWSERIRGNHSVYRKRHLGWLRVFWAPSYFDSSPLHELVYDCVDGPSHLRSTRLVRVAAVSLDDGELTFVGNDAPDFREWVIASAAFPIFLNPVEINGHRWVDGGIRSVTPLGEAIRLGADEIDIIMCSDPRVVRPWSAPPPSRKNPFTRGAFPATLLRVLDIYSDQIMDADISVACAKNQLSQLNPKYKHVKMNIIAPSTKLTSNVLSFNHEDIMRMMKLGYDAARSLNIT